MGDQGILAPYYSARMRSVVTGGAGFVGSNLVAALLQRGDHVTVVDDFFTGQEDAIPNGCEFIRACVTEYRVMRLVCRRADVVFHLAARNIIVSTQNPADDFRINAGGTLNVLLAARDENVGRVVYASSCSVYGDQPAVPILESDPVSLLTPYAASKFTGEAYCQAFGASYGLATSVVRYSNVYGPGHLPENPYCGVIARFIHDSMEGRPMRIYGGGEQTRDYTYVSDVVTATMLAADGPAGSVYNVGTGRETSVNRLAEMIGGEVEHVGLRDIDNVSRRSLSYDRIHRGLGWKPSVELRDGLTHTLSWMENR
jgi:UDP-glucose 4-epimerase